MENAGGFEQEEGCSLGEKECCVAERYLLIEDSKNTVYLKLFSLMIFPGFFFFLPLKTLFSGVALQERNSSGGSIRLYRVGKTGRLEWEANSFSLLLCWVRWMSATDMSLPLKWIFILLSASTETVCCHRGDR